MAKWKEITTTEQWEQLYEGNKPFVILKHSTACPVSTNALQEFEKYLEDDPQKLEYVMVKVIESRPVSNRIAEDTGVKHESPQMLYVDNKKTIWNTSHWSVTKAHMSAVLD